MLNGDSVDVKSAQKFLGHADLQVTLKIYTHLSEGKEQAAVDALNKYFGNNKGQIHLNPQSDEMCPRILRS